MNQPHVKPRPAATIILARNSTEGVEVLMMQRTTAVDFATGMHVFPGGAVDPTDHHPEIASLCVGLDDQRASQMLGIEQGGLAYWIAAIRECFEESGLLLGYRNEQDLVRLHGEDAERLGKLRLEMAQNKLIFADILKTEQFRAATDKIAYYSHWITQAGRPKRYDTRFFVAQAPEGQIAEPDNHETVGQVWVRPDEALEMNKAGTIELMFPTIRTLESLTPFKEVEELLEYARAPKPKTLIAPFTATARNGDQHILIPGDFAYTEVRKIDPDNKGSAHSFIEPGQPVAIGTHITRVTAANPGMMTGPGTNTYLIGDAQTGVAVIDPGPLLEEHIQNILNAADGPIKWILCTHTHIDHSPAATRIKEKTGAQVYGRPAPAYPNQDQTFAPDHVVAHDEVLKIAGVTLRVIHTPGHASNQVCFLHEEQHMLFTGDHIMQGSTVVINPPDGNMAQYLESLKLITKYSIDYLAPGHGFLMSNANEIVDRLVIHRLGRENKVLAALRGASQPLPLEELVKHAYADTDQRLHKVAMRSLQAHLDKLVSEGRAHHQNGVWSPTH